MCIVVPILRVMCLWCSCQLTYTCLQERIFELQARTIGGGWR
ncbi:UcrQ family protein [Blastomyces dermatitidis ATCC 18188]|uniref:UcrQ family protein n=1 Tax=Ajellomyces dermatitidis (strain ATCC 18188 / CBS 674.68) TaxID=653446 RepID=F2TI92_AJEDA|nr:UcrQ family protein [Blastomyces dermatitidis ATCC 18188]